MRGRTIKGIIAAAVLMSLPLITIRADVVSKPATLLGRSGQPVFVPLDLDVTSGEVVGGINGELVFDPNIFENPQAEIGNGTLGFIALGNLVAPGQYRFVLYADPTQAVDLSQNAMHFRLDVKEGLPADTETTVSFNNAGTPAESRSAASTTNGISIPVVTFNEVQVTLNKTGTTRWIEYR